MLKLLKYEYRKKLTQYIILIIAFAAVYFYSIVAMLLKDRTNTVISMALFSMGIFFGIIYIMVLAIESYSRELSSKTSYMLFMTPNSTYKIISAKVLSTFIASIVLAFIYILMFLSQYKLCLKQFPQVDSLKEMMEQMMSLYGNYTQINIVGTVVVTVVLMWVQIFTIVCIAYFATTLSRTFLSNKRGRGFLSFVIFCIITLIYVMISNAMPVIEFGGGITESVFSELPAYLLSVVVIIASVIGTSGLLEKKISL